MEKYRDAILELAKSCHIEYVTSSRLVTSRPCFLFSAVITPDDADNKSRVYLRNGELVTSNILLNFKARYAHPLHYACPPIHFTRGLYVELNDNADGVTIQYIEE